MNHLTVLRDYFVEDRINKEIKANITCLMINVLLPEELITVPTNSANEFYLVSEYLFNELKKLNQPVVEFQNLHIWARIKTNNSLKNDPVLIEIFGGKINDSK